ncbi:MAG: TonB family protein [Candidatus Omnitrophica bacterium]|nr:TonB family protein [Candidatus Omnitrophota bacterium]
MTGENNLLFKAFLVSLSIHIGSISLFSLKLPQAGIQKPIEVSIVSPSEAQEISASVRTETTSATSKTAASNGKFTLPEEKGTIKISPKEPAAVPTHGLNPQITEKFGLPDFFTDIEIEGPIGERTLIHRETLEYPEWLREKAVEGDVTIKFWVDPSGKIAITSLLASSGSSELDVYAEQVFRKWLFEPATTDKETWGIITFHF